MLKNVHLTEINAFKGACHNVLFQFGINSFVSLFVAVYPFFGSYSWKNFKNFFSVIILLLNMY